MKIKNGASIQGLDIRMRPALIAADRIWRKLGQELVITSGLDGEHSAGSLHYYGLAVDMRNKYFIGDDKQVAADKLRNSLNDDFDIVTHASHIHVEYDPNPKSET